MVKKIKLIEGTDLTQILSIKKYDPEGDAERLEQTRRENEHRNRLSKYLKRFAWYRKFLPKTRTSFPNFISKTDEPRVQLFPNIENLLHNNGPVDVTEKLDGQSGTFFLMRNPKRYQIWKPYLFGVCSRNFQLNRPDGSSYWVIAKQEKIEAKLRSYLCSHPELKYIVVQGEIIGPKIQDNKYNRTKYELYVFNVVLGTNTSKTYSSLPNNLVESISKELGLNMVPIIETRAHAGDTDTKRDIFHLVPKRLPELVEYAKGQSQLAPIPREGVVIRQGQLYVDFSFKVINTDFLLKYGE